MDLLIKERCSMHWSWTARFILGTNIVLATSCEGVTEIYKYNKDTILEYLNSNEYESECKFESVEDYICEILEDEDLLDIHTGNSNVKFIGRF